MIDTQNPLPTFQAGDVLLYRPKKGSFFGQLISIKTWHRISHCEVYVGDHQSVAARDGIGVNLYPVRETELARVLRPNVDLNLKKALQWFDDSAKGQKYDWAGLLVFTLAKSEGAKDKMFCSEFVTRFLRAGDMEPFTERCDADGIAPFEFDLSPKLDCVWRDDPPEVKV